MNTKTDQELLRELNEVEKELRNHWLWRELDCTPETFFLALDNYLHDCPLTNTDRASGLKKLKRSLL